MVLIIISAVVYYLFPEPLLMIALLFLGAIIGFFFDPTISDTTSINLKEDTGLIKNDG
jgi:hypothetical protein